MVAQSINETGAKGSGLIKTKIYSDDTIEFEEVQLVEGKEKHLREDKYDFYDLIGAEANDIVLTIHFFCIKNKLASAGNAGCCGGGAPKK